MRSEVGQQSESTTARRDLKLTDADKFSYQNPNKETSLEGFNPCLSRALA